MYRSHFVVISVSCLVSGLVSGCAIFKTKDKVVEKDGVKVVEVSAPQESQSVASAGGTLLGASILTERSDLKSFDKIEINLPSANVSVTTGRPKGKGLLRANRAKGDAECKVYVEETDQQSLYISTSPRTLMSAAVDKVSGLIKHASRSAIPSTSRCHFEVELAVHQATDLKVDLKRGSIFVEDWNAPIDAKLDWGDIDVGNLEQLSVRCGRCTLTGENIKGPLRFDMDAGNVGLAGLEGAVEGQTLGDTILKWKKLKSSDKIKVSSRAGDVILFFPNFIPVALDLRAPRGEVYTGNARAVSEHKDDSARGIPVIATAELGNVRIYRAK